MDEKGIGIGQVSRAPTLDEERERLLPQIKELRKDIDALIQRVAERPTNEERTGKEIFINDWRTREVQKQVAVKLIEAKMWSGKILEYLGNPFPAELADKANVQ
jgi:hypothetical protein